MRLNRSSLREFGFLSFAILLAGCGKSVPSARRAATTSATPGMMRIDASDTAAYASAGPDAVAAVARCRPPACRPDIFSGPGPGELTVGLDSGRPSEFQWHHEADAPAPGGQAFQDSSWLAMIARWDSSVPRRLLLIDGTPRTYAYARAHVSLSSVWRVQEVPAKDAKALSTDPAAANGAIVIVTKAHAPH